MAYRTVIECDYCQEQQDVKANNLGLVQDLPENWHTIVVTKDGTEVARAIICPSTMTKRSPISCPQLARITASAVLVPSRCQDSGMSGAAEVP